MDCSRNESSCQQGGIGKLPAGTERAQGAAHPCSNTGAQSALVDWAGFTFPDSTPVERVQQLLGAADWVPMETGRYGYRQALKRGHVTISFDGQPGMGVHVEASGQGCRELEGAAVVSDWPSFFASLFENGAKFSRLDVAIDDTSGQFNVDTVAWHVEQGLVVSRYKSANVLQSVRLASGDSVGSGVRFGSGQGDSLVRLYDKAAEQGWTEGYWTRCELQTRDKRADHLARILAGAGTLQPVAGVILGLLDFKVRGEGLQKCRWKTAAWWTAFLGAVEKLRLTLAPVVRTLAAVSDWLDHAIAPTLAALVDAYGGKTDVVKRLIERGRLRYRGRHLDLIAAGLSRQAIGGCSA